MNFSRRIVYPLGVVLVIAAFWVGQPFFRMAEPKMPANLFEFKTSDPVPLCARWRDTMPSIRDERAFRIYIAARKVLRSKVEWQLSRGEAQRILDDVKQAAGMGDWGARALLASLYRMGLGPLDSNNVLQKDFKLATDITRSAMEAGQAWGFYDMGIAYEQGYGGVQRNNVIAWAHYRQAAILGSPEGQMTLAQAYQKAGMRDAYDFMVHCAYSQGHGPAAYQLGTRAFGALDFLQGIAYYHEGVKFGDESCARALSFFFEAGPFAPIRPEEQKKLDEMNFAPDMERAKRYYHIADVLELNPDLRLARLDTVFTPFPSPLPKWDGEVEALENEVSSPPAY